MRSGFISYHCVTLDNASLVPSTAGTEVSNYKIYRFVKGTGIGDGRKSSRHAEQPGLWA